MNFIKALEISLHQYDVRASIDKLKKLLHPDFIEIGYSGKTFDFDSILNDLVSESLPDYKVWSQEYKYIEYARNVIQVIYLSARLDKEGKLNRYAKRTSIWVNEPGSWQIKFHQVTPIDPFEKLNA